MADVRVMAGLEMGAFERLAARLQSPRIHRPWHLLVGLLLPCVVLAVHMAQVWDFTVDDAYISFRYARNLADGHGLVYNPGQRVEGYTNFLWTVILAGGELLRIDPHHTSKILGAAAALGTLWAVWRLSARALPFGWMPCLSTWLLATAAPFSGYAVFGLETSLFAFLVIFGVLRVLEEEGAEARIPWSGLLLAAATLTRPEGPLFAGLALLLPGRRLFSRRNLLRAAAFLLPVLAHLAWRRSYYGLWVPFTAVAKTGDAAGQLAAGRGYVLDYLRHAGPVVYMALYGAGLGFFARITTLAYAGVTTGLWCFYVAVVGGDWMQYFRFMAPIEPWLFLLGGVALRSILETRKAAAIFAVTMFLAISTRIRGVSLGDAQRKWMVEERTFWRNAAGQTADWLKRQPPGVVGIGDIGYVGWATNYPLLDFLGLVDPVIGRLPGGYTRKLGRGFLDRIYSVKPDYLVFILSGQSCDKPEMPGSRQIYRDSRFKDYEVGFNVQVGAGASWCIFRRKPGH